MTNRTQDITFGIFSYGLWGTSESKLSHLHKALLKGILQHISPRVFLTTIPEYHACDIAVMFGVPDLITSPYIDTDKRPIRKIIYDAHVNVAKKPIIIAELGTVKRDFPYYAIGFNMNIGLGNYCNHQMPDDRWKKLNIQTKPWRQNGKHILLCGQIPHDTSIQYSSEPNHAKWIYTTAEKLMHLTQRPIVYRPHPKFVCDKHPIPTGCLVSNHQQLADDLQDCWAVVTFNSTTGVDALIAGIPTYVSDKGSMAYRIAHQDLATIENPPLPNRTQWLNDLAYTQWSLDEIANAEPFKHLLPRMPKSYWPQHIAK